VRRLSFPFWFISYYWPRFGYDVAAIYAKEGTDPDVRAKSSLPQDASPERPGGS
jgi:hypothetical protein